MRVFLRPEPEHFEDAPGPAFHLHCPVCGQAGQTTGQPSDDGSSVVIPMEGDCRHRWELVVSTRGGQTSVYARVQAGGRGRRHGPSAA
jgi:hypothetical protein